MVIINSAPNVIKNYGKVKGILVKNPFCFYYIYDFTTNGLKYRLYLSKYR